jgi:hypothetical protein
LDSWPITVKNEAGLGLLGQFDQALAQPRETRLLAAHDAALVEAGHRVAAIGTASAAV